MEYTELLLKYDQITDGARIVTSQLDWNKIQGTLLGKGGIICITVKNVDDANSRTITLNSDPVPYNSFVSIEVLTPGGSLNPADLKLGWPNGNANVSIVIDRITNLRYVKVPVREK